MYFKIPYIGNGLLSNPIDVEFDSNAPQPLTFEHPGPE